MPTLNRRRFRNRSRTTRDRDGRGRMPIRKRPSHFMMPVNDQKLTELDRYAREEIKWLREQVIALSMALTAIREMIEDRQQH